MQSFVPSSNLRMIQERLASLLKACDNLKQLNQIQAQVVSHGLHCSPFLAPKLASCAFRLRNPVLARMLFDQTPAPSVVHFNVMFKGYSDAGSQREALELFRLMLRGDVRPSHYTFPFVIKSCDCTSSAREGEELHCVVIKTGFESDGFVGPALIGMYSSRGGIDLAREVFAQMSVKNVVVSTAMIVAYLSIGDVVSAHEIFDRTLERDVILWNTMVLGYAARGDMVAARLLFDRMPNRDVMSWNTILRSYAESGDLEACLRIFDEMPERNVFSWNGLIGGFSRHGRNFEILDAFKWMLQSSNVKPNDATLVSVLSACSKLGALNWGRWIHVYALYNGFKGNIYVGNGLIDMYAKCGCIADAVSVFHSMEAKDLITWNSIIGGLAMHGHGAEALELFHQMTSVGEKPDGITFVGILSACVHMGLLEDGLRYFTLMTKNYSISPWIEHYGCMVDLVGRAGLLNKALGIIMDMPMETDCIIWSSLLWACQVHRDVSLAEFIVNRLIKLGQEDVANYVVLSNIYGATGRWREAAALKRMVRRSNLGKSPGCSLIEVSGEVVEFFSSDSGHPQICEIYKVMEGLMTISRFARDEPEFSMHCEET
ncbi:pentatricopeptide repeat-containing protein At2g20540 [Typha angustifolia]|uniref:pentatricopeptide repeat-containing protein At2g20540 n=1 Tax=Typha angustifolia TaxID=59011 RepID=UPI003C2D24CC